MKVSNVNPVNLQKIKTNAKITNVKNFVAENKKTLGAIGAMAGLVGLAIYAAAAIKPSGITPNIYNEYVKNHENDNNNTKIIYPSLVDEKEAVVNDLKAKLKQSQTLLNNDLEEQARIGNLLTVPELRNKEFFQQQHDILNDFIDAEQKDVGKLTAELQKAEKDLRKAKYRY